MEEHREATLTVRRRGRGRVPKSGSFSIRLERGYGEHLQLSVFRCELSARELSELRAKLGAIIHHTEDQVLFVHVGLSEGRAVGAFSTLGRPHVETERAAIVV